MASKGRAEHLLESAAVWRPVAYAGPVVCRDQMGIEALYIEPGSPWKNGYAENFHSRLPDELLALETFENLSTTRRLTAVWKKEYNGCRPHRAL